jgi:hypothetical protein
MEENGGTPKETASRDRQKKKGSKDSSFDWQLRDLLSFSSPDQITNRLNDLTMKVS